MKRLLKWLHENIPDRTERKYSLRRYVRTLLSVIMLIIFLLFGTSITLFTYRSEELAWRGRQGEASRNAAQVVSSFLQRANDTLSLLGLVDRTALTPEAHIFEDLFKENTSFMEVIRADASGKVFAIAYQDQPVLGNLFTITQSKWFQTALSGQRYYSSVMISSSNIPYLIVSAPAPDGGVVAARISMQVLWSVVGDIRFGEKGIAYVIDRDGDVITHTNHDVVINHRNIRQRPEFTAISNAESNCWFGEYTNFDQIQVVGASIEVPGTNWIVITELPQDEAFSSSRISIISMIVLFLVSLIMTNWYIFQRMEVLIFQPLEAMRQGAERIGQGDLNYQIQLSAKDELGKVADSFNQMSNRLVERDDLLNQQAITMAEEIAERKSAVEALQRAHAELELRVSERTAALKATNDELQSEILERMRVEEQIKASLQEKDVLMKEIHHRVKNNLQVISSLLNLQMQKVSDATTLEILRESQNRVRSMALIHEKLYQSSDLARIDFATYVRNMAGYLVRSYGTQTRRVGIHIQTDEVPLVINLAVPCGLILNELISNCLKHAFPDDRDGQITICLQRIGSQRVALVVQDNGVGIPPDVNIWETKSLGMQLVQTLIRQIGGSIDLEQDQGSKFTITFDLP